MSHTHSSTTPLCLLCLLLGGLLCVEQSLIELWGPGQAAGDPRPWVSHTLAQPVRLDPLSAEVTPNTLCSLQGQLSPLFTSFSSRGQKTTITAFFFLFSLYYNSGGAVLWLQGITRCCLLFSVSPDCHEMQTHEF